MSQYTRIKTVALLLFALLICSCNHSQKEADLAIKTETLYNDSNAKLWKHRVNTIADLSALSEFPGIELDLVFDTISSTFNVRHNKTDPNSDLSFMQMLDSIPNAENYYYWLDVKNLDYPLVSREIKRFDEITQKHKIKDRIIIESYNTYPLKMVHQADYYTSYWVPAFDYENADEETILTKKEKLTAVLAECKHNALSATYQMAPYLTKYFPSNNIHLWTNGLITEEDKKIINALSENESIKVILVDYSEDFLRNKNQ